MDMSEILIEKVERAINCAENNISKLDELNVRGMSTRKIRVMLNELIGSKTKYLEVGVWKGSTFIAALYKNTPLFACAIDDFSHHDGNKAEVFKENCASNGIKDFILFENDCFNLAPEQKSLLKDINVYFYDGAHTEETQEKALTYYYDNLASDFIYIVDDWSYPPVVIGTRNGIQKTNIKIVKEWQLPGMAKKFHDPNPETSKHTKWWNGMYVAVCKKQT